MKRERKEKRVKVEEGRWMPSCKAHRQSAVTPLDVLTEIALESRASVCSWLIRWIERLELSKRGKALRQASEQHCWETQGIIYQGRHVWLILQHTPALSCTQPPNSSFDTDTERKRSQAGTNIWVKTTTAAAAAANSQLVFTLNWNLSYSSKWGHQYSLWCPPPLPPPRQRFWLALHNGSRWRGWYLHSDTTKTRHSNAINESINQWVLSQV